MPQARPDGSPVQGADTSLRLRTLPIPAPPAVRRYRIAWLTPAGRIAEATRWAPDAPLFTRAFTALGRGALVTTEDGQIAVEDLLPGMRVPTTAGLQRLLWKGRGTVEPDSDDARLYRIPMGALGPGRPASDLVLGFAARIAGRFRPDRARDAGTPDLVDVAALADGETAVEIRPVSSVETFHLAFARPAALRANGLEIASLTPEPDKTADRPALRALYLSIFPHLIQGGRPWMPDLALGQGDTTP